MTQKVRKDGFPVLAYSSLDDSAPMLSLLFRIKSPRRATLSLKSAYHGSGHDDALTFILQINPGDLVPEPGQNFLTPANLSLTQERLNAVQRQGNPNIRTLCLTLRQWCSIWYPKSMTTTPLRGVHPPLDELASLATASKLHLLFDMNWLGSEKKNVFEEFIHCPDRFTACPVEEHYSKEYAPLDWTLFDAPAYRDSTTDQEDPTPPYSVAIVKRARRTSTPSPPPSSLKRLLTSSDLGAIHTNTIEKDSAGTPHTKPEHSSRSSTAALSSSPYAATPRRDLRLLVDDILERSLMGRIGNLLPSLIEQLVTAPPPSPSQRSVASERSTTPSPLDLTPFGKTLGDYLMQRISAKFDALYEETLSHADFRRRVADDEFQDQLEEERLALNREAESTFHGLKQKCADLEEDVTERVERRVEELLELLEKHTGDLDSEGRASPAYGRTELRRKSAELRMREEDLRNERAAFRTERLAFLREKAEFRKEKAELEKEKLHAQTAGEALYKGKDFSFPELPDCCVLP